MASTNKTPRLGLSQWVLSDPFRMEDFNNDNAKIDDGFKAVDQRFTDMSANMNTALAPLALVKIGEVITSQSCQQIDLDVSGIEWAKYYKVVIYWRLVHNSTANSGQSVMAILTVNNCNEQRYFISTSGVKDYPSNTSTTLFQLSVDDLTRNNFPRYKTELFMEDGCAFLNQGSSLFAGNYYNASALQISASDRTPAPIDTLKNLNYRIMCYPNFVSLLPGSKFEIYGVRK